MHLIETHIKITVFFINVDLKNLHSKLKLENSSYIAVSIEKHEIHKVHRKEIHFVWSLTPHTTDEKHLTTLHNQIISITKHFVSYDNSQCTKEVPMQY